MQKICFTIAFCLLYCGVSAQIEVDLMGGTSKADRVFGQLSASWVGPQGFRAGVRLKQANYQYRFIDARPVSDGQATELRLLLSFPLAIQERIRLDAFLHPGLRWIQAPEGIQEFNYAFSSSQGLVLDPGLVVSFFPIEKLSLHTGVNMHMAWQTRPSTVFEQFPSAMLLVGAAYQLHPDWSLLLNIESGPNSGASGDSEKYGWQIAAGLRFRIGQGPAPQLLTGF